MTSHAIHSEPPAVLTVAEVRRVLRISRTKTYEQANAYLETGGADGIPCVRVGTSLRFPRLLLEQYIEQPITVAQLDPANDPTERAELFRFVLARDGVDSIDTDDPLVALLADDRRPRWLPGHDLLPR